MFCMQCGQRLEEGANFCPVCGAAVPDLSPKRDGDRSEENVNLSNDMGSASPYCVKEPDTTGENAPPSWEIKPVEEPWGTGTPRSTSAVSAATKKKNRIWIIGFAGLLAVLLVGGAVARLMQPKSSAAQRPGYERLIESYFYYAQDSQVTEITTLFHPAVYAGYVDAYGYFAALSHADSWNRHYGQEVQQWQVASVDVREDELETLNGYFVGLDAGQYMIVDVDVSYTDGSYGLAEFDVIQTDEGWFFVQIW